MPKIQQDDLEQRRKGWWGPGVSLGGWVVQRQAEIFPSAWRELAWERGAPR